MSLQEKATGNYSVSPQDISTYMPNLMSGLAREPSVRPFDRWSLVVAASTTCIAIAYSAALGPILTWVRGFYRIEVWRQLLLNDRLIGYRAFLIALAAA